MATKFSIHDPIKILAKLPARPALADAGPNARPGRGAPLSNDFMTSSCSVNRVTIVVERRYTAEVYRSRSVGVDSGRSLNDFRK